MVLDVRSDQPGYVVLTDAWYPGWKARVNDVSTEIFRANYLLRAVEVGAGASTIVLHYEPESFCHGASISGVSLLELLVGGTLLYRRNGARWSLDRHASSNDVLGQCEHSLSHCRLVW